MGEGVRLENKFHLSLPLLNLEYIAMLQRQKIDGVSFPKKR